MSFEHKSLQCSDCGTTFTFSAEEQEFYQSKGYTNEPKRCPDCRQARKSERYGNSGYRSFYVCCITFFNLWFIGLYLGYYKLFLLEIQRISCVTTGSSTFTGGIKCVPAKFVEFHFCPSMCLVGIDNLGIWLRLDHIAAHDSCRNTYGAT